MRTSAASWQSLAESWKSLSREVLVIREDVEHAKRSVAEPLFPRASVDTVPPSLAHTQTVLFDLAGAMTLASGAAAICSDSLLSIANRREQASLSRDAAVNAIRQVSDEVMLVKSLPQSPELQVRLAELERQLIQLHREQAAAQQLLERAEQDSATTLRDCNATISNAVDSVRAIDRQLGVPALATTSTDSGHGSAGPEKTGLGGEDGHIQHGVRTLDYLTKVDTADGALRVGRYVGMGSIGGAQMLAGRAGGSQQLFRTGVGRYGAANRWVRGVKAPVVLGVAADTTMFVANAQEYGLGDARTLEPAVSATGTLASAGVVAASFGSATAGLGAASFGGGMLIGQGLDQSVGWATGSSITDRWSDAAVGDELAAFEVKLDRGESLSDSELERLDDLQSIPTIAWESFKSLFGK